MTTTTTTTTASAEITPGKSREAAEPVVRSGSGRYRQSSPRGSCPIRGKWDKAYPKGGQAAEIAGFGDTGDRVQIRGASAPIWKESGCRQLDTDRGARMVARGNALLLPERRLTAPVDTHAPVIPLWGRALKRTVDVVVSGLLLVLLLPVLIAIAVAVRIDS